jgi:TP901 family phage tail tape measure protein
MDLGTMGVTFVLKRDPNNEDEAKKTKKQISEIEQEGKKLIELSKDLLKTGAVMSAAITAPLVAFGKGVLQVGMDFEAGLSGIKAVTGATAGEMERLKTAALDAGEKTKYSAAESANAIEELAKAGLSTAQILEGGLAGALTLAAAGEIGVADAAEIAATVLNAFRDDALSVGEAANILAGGANASATDVAGLRMGLSQAAAVASGAGFTFMDTATALAVFAQNGLKGSDAGTSLKTMLLNLQPTTDRQITLFQELGLMTADGANAFYDMEGKLRPLDEIAGLLHTSMADLTDQERSLALEIMFGSDAIRAGNILYREGAEGVTSMADAMQKVEAADVAAERMNNLKGRVEEAAGKFETLKIKIFDAETGPLNSLVGTVDTVIGKLLGMDESSLQAAVGIAGVAGAIGPLLLVAAPLIGTVGKVVTEFGAISAAATAAGGTAGIGGFVSAIGAALGPVGIFVAAVAAIGTAAVLVGTQLSKTGLEIEDFSKDVSKETQEAAGAFIDLVKTATEQLTQLSLAGPEKTKAMAGEIAGTYAQMRDDALDAITDQAEEMHRIMMESFKDSTEITQEEQTALLKSVEEGYLERIKAVEGAEGEIREILVAAAGENRSLREDERQRIKELQDLMAAQGIESMAKGESEQTAILTRLTENTKKLTAEAAAAVAKEAIAAKDGAIKAAQEECDQVVADYEAMKVGASAEMQALADKGIKEAIRQKDETVAAAREQHAGIIQEAQAQAGDHVSKVNWETGEIYNSWQQHNIRLAEAQMANDRAMMEAWGLTAGEAIDAGGEMGQGLVDGVEGKIPAAKNAGYRLSKAVIEAAREEADSHSPSRKMQALGVDMDDGLALGIEGGSDGARESIIKVSDSLTDVIKKGLDEQIIVVQDAEFQKAGIYSSSNDATVQGVRLFNQSVIADYENAAASVIEALNEQAEGVKGAAAAEIDAARQKAEIIKESYAAEIEAVKERADSIKDVLTEEVEYTGTLTEQKYKIWSDEYIERVKLVDERVGAEVEGLQTIIKEEINRIAIIDQEAAAEIRAIQDQIDALDELTAAEKKATQEAAEAKKLANLQKAINEAETDEEMSRAREKYNDYVAELDQKRTEEARKAEKDRLKGEIETIESSAKEQIKASDTKITTSKKTQEDMVAALQTALASMGSKLEEALKEVAASIEKSARDNKGTVAKIADETEEERATILKRGEEGLAELKNRYALQLETSTGEHQEKLRQIFAGGYDDLVEETNTGAGKMHTAFSEILAKFGPTVQDEMSSLQALALGWYERLTTDGGEGAGSLVEIFGSELAVISENTGLTLEEVAGIIETMTAQMAEDAGEAGENVAKEFDDGTEPMAEDMQATMDDVKDTITNAGPDIKTEAETAGGGAVDGFADGMEKKKSFLLTVAAGIFSPVISLVNQIFDEHSPSKVMYAIGENVVTGFTNGVSDGILAVNASGIRLATVFLEGYNAVVTDGFKESTTAVMSAAMASTKVMEEAFLQQTVLVAQATANKIQADALEQESIRHTQAMLEIEMGLLRLDEQLKDGTIAAAKARAGIHLSVEEMYMNTKRAMIENQEHEITKNQQNEAQIRQQTEANSQAYITQMIDDAYAYRYEITQKSLSDQLTILSDQQWKEVNLTIDGKEKKIQIWNEEYIEKLRLVDERTYAEISGIQEIINAEIEKIRVTNAEAAEMIDANRAKIAELQAESAAVKKAEEEKAEAKRLTEFQSRIEAAKTDEERIKAEAALTEYIESQEQKRTETARQEEIKRLTSENSTIAESVKAQTEASLAKIDAEKEAQAGIIDALQAGIKQQQEFFKQYYADLISDAKSRGADIGKNIGAGISSGLDSTKSSLYAQAKAMASSIASAMKDALQITSPSKVTRRIGEDTGAGVVLGLEDSMGDILSASEDLAGASIAGFGGQSLGSQYGMVARAEQAVRAAVEAKARQPAQTVQNQRSQVIHQSITINAPETPSPAETARASRNALRRLSWGVV